VLTGYFVGVLVVLFFFLISLCFPKFITKPCYVLLSHVPTHAFALAILCGSGAGVIASHGIFLAMLGAGIPVRSTAWHYWIIPEVCSAPVTAVVTSWLCHLWQVLDIASALYFAPLVFPSLVFAQFFSVQWISVGVDTWTTMPPHFFVDVILVIVFVKIPINLIARLFGRPAGPRNRAAVHGIADALYGFRTGNALPHRVSRDSCADVRESLDRLPSVSLSSECGSAARRIGRYSRWWRPPEVPDGLWIVHNLWTCAAEGRSSTLQQTLHPTMTGIICSGLALACGIMSVIFPVFGSRSAGSPRRAGNCIG
jgi:hypothetical protein